jgi:hypothetical protein
LVEGQLGMEQRLLKGVLLTGKTEVQQGKHGEGRRRRGV